MASQYHVAIDGYAATGKSTAARLLAARLKILYIDTGAMYRAHALLALESGKNPQNAEEMVNLLTQFEYRIELGASGCQNLFLGAREITREIRQPAISGLVSETCKHKIVRDFMVDLQRRLAKNQNTVMEGRDIGTVVLPEARFKFFFTAQEKVRAERRLREWETMGLDVDLPQVRRDIGARDALDANRKVAPLARAPDAMEIDTTSLNVDQVVEKMYNYILKNIYMEE
jgi:CMP/dCMP kinase